jgi:hypothetical protein
MAMLGAQTVVGVFDNSAAAEQAKAALPHRARVPFSPRTTSPGSLLGFDFAKDMEGTAIRTEDKIGLPVVSGERSQSETQSGSFRFHGPLLL